MNEPARAKAEALALEDAKRLAIEQAGTYFESYTHVKQGIVTKDEMNTLARGIAQLLPGSMKAQYVPIAAGGGAMKLTVAASFSVDTGRVERTIEALRRQERQQQEEMKNFKALQQATDRLLEENHRTTDRAANFSKLAQSQKDFKQINARAVALYKEGMLAGNSERFKKAIRKFTEAIAISPNYADAYFSRGVVYTKLARSQLALQDLGKAIELRPTDDKYYAARATFCLTIEQYAQSLSDYDRSIALNPYAWSYKNGRGTVYFYLGHYKQALSDYNQILAANPYDYLIYFNRAFVYDALHQYGQATADFKRVLELNPSFIDEIPANYRKRLA